MSEATDDARAPRPSTLVLRDGRTLEVLTRGPDRRDSPSSFTTARPSRPFPMTLRPAASRPEGVRLVYWSRPGYAGSTSQPGRRVADAAADTGEVLDVLGHDRFVTLGWSGGGPHALACAALMPGRCRSAAIIAGVAPFDAEGLDFLDGMGPENIEEFGLAAAGRSAVLGVPDPGVGAAHDADGPRHGRGPRRSRLRGGQGGSHRSAGRLHGEGPGRGGVRAAPPDGTTTTWPFWATGDSTSTDVGCPVSIWQGRQDRMVPYAHGEWLASHVPGARPHLLPDEGHVSLFVRCLRAHPRRPARLGALTLRIAAVRRRRCSGGPGRVRGVGRGWACPAGR